MAFLDELDNLREGQYLEFKEASFTLPDDLWESYSAFANAGGGEIVLGIREKPRSTNADAHVQKEFEIVGIQDAEGIRDLFWKTVRDITQVSVDVMYPDDVYPIEIEGKCLLVIAVPRAQRTDKPVCVLDRTQRRSKPMQAYIRRGEGDFRCTKDELERMRHDASLHEADNLIIEEMTPDALCERTVETYRSLLASRTPPHPWAKEERDDLLLLLKALGRGVDGELHPTMAGLLAFGYEHQILSYLATYHLDYRVELGTTSRWVDRFTSMSGDWSGNLVDFYLGVTQRIDRELPRPLGLVDNGMRHENPHEINDAVHEAIANALVHAYYGAESRISIVLNLDGIAVRNPGTFLLDRDVAIAGGSPMARNPILARIFAIVGITDVAGSGLRAIYGTWGRRFERAPILTEEFRPDVVEMRLPLTLSAHEESARGGVDVTSSGSDDVPRSRGYTHVSLDDVVDACRMHEVASVADVARVLGMKRSTTQVALKRLVDEGVLKRERDGRKYLYRLAENS